MISDTTGKLIQLTAASGLGSSAPAAEASSQFQLPNPVPQHPTHDANITIFAKRTVFDSPKNARDQEQEPPYSPGSHGSEEPDVMAQELINNFAGITREGD